MVIIKATSVGMMAKRATGFLRFLRPSSFTCQRHNFPDDHAHGLRIIKQREAVKEIDKVLSSGAIEIDFSDYVQSGLLTDHCPIRKVFVNHLSANSPTEDRWNIGFIQVDGVVSSCLLAMLDGHSGTSCVHTLAWSILDYVAAALLDRPKLASAQEFLSTHGLEHPYHLARRLDLQASDGHQRLGHAVGPPPPHLATYMRGCLLDYINELVGRADRKLDPQICLTEALLRLDDDLCSTHRHFTDLVGNEGDTASAATRSHSAPLSRELLRVAVSGAVGLVGHIYWENTAAGRRDHPQQLTRLNLANVGDCLAVLLRESAAGETGLEAISLNTAHQGSTNEAEVNRVSSEHPESKARELFREGGRLLGELAPSRAFGNVRYKWPLSRLRELSNSLDRLNDSASNSRHGPEARLSHPFPTSDLFHPPWPYTSPPYLTAAPEVTSIELTPKDRYLVIGTDGLWDNLSPDEVAHLLSADVAPPHSPDSDWRQSPATRLLWSSLSHAARANEGAAPRQDNPRVVERALQLLSLPPGLARFYRDDITVMVIELADRRRGQ